MGTCIVYIAMNGWRGLQVRSDGTREDLKSALAVRVPFRAVCAFFGSALFHIGSPLLQFGYPFLKGFDAIHSPSIKHNPVVYYGR